MTTANTIRRVYTVPAWAKQALGAARARRMAREEMAVAKANGATFEQACQHIDDAFDAWIEAEEMAEIERTAYYGLGPNPYR